MQSSFPVYLFWGVIFLAVVLDLAIVWVLKRYFRKRDVSPDLKSRFRYLRTEVFSARNIRLKWMFQLEQRIFSGYGLLISVLLFSFIPPFLVVRASWFESHFGFPWLYWYGTKLPAYFSLVILSCIAILILILRSKGDQLVIFVGMPLSDFSLPIRKNVSRFRRTIGVLLIGISIVAFLYIVVSTLTREYTPGWDMALVISLYLSGWVLCEFSFEKSFAVQWGLISAMLLAHIGVVLFLYNTYGRTERLWAYDLLFLVILVNLVKYWRKIPLVYWVVTLALFLFTLKIDAWYFSVIGDEYDFFNYARNIVQNSDFASIGEHLFSGQAVYSSHPYFSSLVQAIFMWVFGGDSFAWRFSNPYLTALSIGFFYLFLKAFLSPRLALLTSFFLAASHYLMSFGKIGYNNLQALFVMSFAFWAITRAIQTQRLAAFAVLGLSLGSCFYVYPAALYIIPLPLLLLFLYLPPRSKALTLRWLVVLLTMLALLFPLLSQPEYWQAKVPGTILYNPKLIQSTTSIAQHFKSNLLYAFFSFLYLPQETHFVSTAYLDPFSSAMALIGMMVLLRQARGRFAWFFLLSFVFLLIAVGASHDREFPPTTRMFLLLPWFAVFVAVGLEWVLKQIRSLSHPSVVRIATFFVVTIVLCLNIFMAYNLSVHRVSVYQNLEALFLRTAQRAAQLPNRITFTFITGEDWGLDGIYFLKNAYGVPETYEQIRHVVVVDGKLPSDVLISLQSPDSVAIFARGLEDSWLEGLEIELASIGKHACYLENAGGLYHYKLWHSGDLDQLCHD